MVWARVGGGRKFPPRNSPPWLRDRISLNERRGRRVSEKFSRGGRGLGAAAPRKARYSFFAIIRRLAPTMWWVNLRVIIKFYSWTTQSHCHWQGGIALTGRDSCLSEGVRLRPGNGRFFFCCKLAHCSRPRFVLVSFDALYPGLESGAFDLSLR